MGAPHFAHAAAAQQLDQAVAAERRAARTVLPCHGQDASDSAPSPQSELNRWLTPLVNAHMRDIEVIDAELRMLARAWSVARDFGIETDTADIDQLLDERTQVMEAPVCRQVHV